MTPGGFIIFIKVITKDVTVDRVFTKKKKAFCLDEKKSQNHYCVHEIFIKN